MTDNEQITALLVTAFNNQFQSNYLISDFDIQRVNNGEHHAVAFEVSTKRTDDYLRIRGYFTLGNITKVNQLRMFNESEVGNGLPSVVFGTTGTLGDTFLYGDNNIIRRNFNNQDPGLGIINALMLEAGEGGLLLTDSTANNPSYLLL